MIKNTNTDLDIAVENTEKRTQMMEQVYAELSRPAKEMIKAMVRLLLECKYNYEEQLDRIVPLPEILEKMEIIDIFFEDPEDIMGKVVIHKAALQHLDNMVTKITQYGVAVKGTTANHTMKPSRK